MTEIQINILVAEYRKNYRPLITLPEAAEIARVPLATVHDWSSRGLLDAFKSKRGRRVLLELEAFVRFVVNTPATGGASQKHRAANDQPQH